MTDTKSVIAALAALGESGNAALHAQCAHTLASPGQDLVRIALVADVPDEPVFWCLEDEVQGDGKFDGTQVGRKMAAGL